AAPSDEIELRNLMYTASQGLDHPIAIRYPRGRGELKNWQVPFKRLPLGKSRQLKKGKSIAVLSLGAIQINVSKAIGSLGNPEQVAHFDMRFLHPLDKDCLQMVFDTFETVITIEDGVKTGGFGDAVLHVANAFSFQGKLVKLGIPDRFIE